MLDFRSDTFTRPSPGMREAMARAEVGDDVFREDPTVAELERRAAGLFGREAALLVPSGTMANLIGIALHCGRGDEVILERRTHSFAHEVGGAAALLGAVFHPLDAPSGILSVESIRSAIRPADVHEPISRLVVMENTANLCGGKVVDLEHLRAVGSLCRDRGLGLHLDGARIWNASVASGTPLSDYAAEVDSLSCCLSKGLGCPVGSLVIGDEPDIERARWIRKMLGGGMRQAGVLAACGLYALENHLDRLADDHALAAELAEGLGEVLDERFRVDPPQSNMVLVHTDCLETCERAVAGWAALGILCLALSDTTIRLVTHMDLSPDAASRAVARLQSPRERG
ncbi:MAG: aminotransferase class I/II-fold pyridoxal phosphate-dependent enzyme [Deltaproteobacteria bacterium]|nr:aminotransferase class I/II-fold pyridoxal phosphate-dependent enzyme [Deltaproteobacteria bacterium]